MLSGAVDAPRLQTGGETLDSTVTAHLRLVNGGLAAVASGLHLAFVFTGDKAGFKAAFSDT